LRVDGERVCASLPRSIMQPCFYLERTNDNSFRGSISGLGFAYCDFTRYQGRADVDQPAAWAIVGDCRQIISATEASRPFRRIVAA
jgi:hypothetical protein